MACYPCLGRRRPAIGRYLLFLLRRHIIMLMNWLRSILIVLLIAAMLVAPAATYAQRSACAARSSQCSGCSQGISSGPHGHACKSIKHVKACCSHKKKLAKQSDRQSNPCRCSIKQSHEWPAASEQRHQPLTALVSAAYNKIAHVDDVMWMKLSSNARLSGAPSIQFLCVFLC